MKAFSKRVLSLTMATAMALSIAAVPTTDANAASKYSLTKRTAAYTGKTYNYYLKGVSKSQYAKVSVSGTAKNLVTVKLGSKKIKSSTKINGTGKTLTLKVKASKASSKKYALTAKIYNKKTKKLVKTLKTPTVTVYNNYIKSISGETTLDAGKTTKLTAVKKYSQSTKAVTWSSSNTAVATVAADGTVTGVAAGSSVITATCGNYSKSVRVTVMPVVEAKGVSAVLTNGVAGYTDVAYVNQDAVVVVTARDENGKAVPNASVVIQAPTAGYDNSGNAYPGVVGDKAKTTDANGQATFVIGYPNSGKIKITDTGLVGTVAYTVSVNANIANVETTVKGNVRFAALNIDNIKVDHDKNDGDSYFTNLERGTQATDTASLERTMPLHRDNAPEWAWSVANEYVATQQVSEAGKNNHEVVFEVKPSLKVPGTANTATGVLENTVLVGKETGTYDTYDNKTAVATIEEDTSLLRYATLYVTDINLSKYSHLEVQSYTDKDDKFDHPVGEKQYVYGEQKQGSFAYQIPITDGAVKKVRVTIVSAGQVDTDRNNGCKLESIKYVYNEKSNAVGGLNSDIPGVSIDWDKSSAVYTNEKALFASDLTKLGITPEKTTDTFTYKVPEFPYTGDGVITERDVNGKVVAYYLAPTENAYEYIRETASGEFKLVKEGRYTNQNELSALLANAKIVNTATTRDLSVNDPISTLKAYKATVEEIAAATASTFSTENNGFVLKVNSEKVGYTSMKGVIKGIDESLLDASNKYIYTSVQWNPLPNIDTNAAYLAFVGQKVDVIAQLVDKNNNPVTEKGVSVTFNGYENAFNATGSTPTVKITDVTRLSGGSALTDTNGQAKLTLSSAEFAQLVGVTAKSTSSKYYVALYVGKVEGNPVERADIYWVNANLSYANSSYFFDATKHVNYTDATKNAYKTGVANGAYSTVTVGSQEKFVYVETKNNEIVKDIAHPTVGQNWEYATQAVGDMLTQGALKDKKVIINNININTKAAASNKGTYTISTDGKGIAKGSSKYAQKDYITSKLDASSVTSTTSFKVGDNEYANVGTGTANIGASFKLGVIWRKNGEAINTVNVSGFNAVSSNTSKKVVYVKVTDASGVNPVKDAKVTFEIDNNTISDVVDGHRIGALEAKKVSVSTNSLGIASVEVQDTDLAISTIVTARVEDSIDDTATQTINWVNKKASLSLVSAKSGADMKTVVLTFNNDIEAASLKNDQFVVSYENSGKTYYAKVTGTSVNDNMVTLTLEAALSNVEYTVTVNPAKEDGITYTVVDTTGAGIAVSNTTNFVAGSSATVEITSADVGSTIIGLDGIKLPLDKNDASANMVVTVDGVVVYNDNVAPSLSGTNVFNTTITVPELQRDSVVNVYYYGASTSYTVQ